MSDTTVESLLRRLSKRYVPVPVTEHERAEALRACAEKTRVVRDLENEIISLSEQAKSRKKRVEAIQSEIGELALRFDRDTIDAERDVLVERSPTKPAEMLVWRIPEHRTAFDVLDEQLPEGTELEAHRLAQGCELLESRAMLADELRAAEEEDWRHKHPELPFPDHTEKRVAGLEVDADDDETLIDEDPDSDDGAAPDPREEGGDHHDRDEADVNGDKAPTSTPAKRAAPPKPQCPYLVTVGASPMNDEICGAPGSTRSRGFCPAHRDAPSTDRNRALTRKASRRLEQDELAKKKLDDELDAEAAQ